MKNISIIILFLLSCLSVQSQSKIKYKDKPLFAQADFAFYQGNYAVTKDIFKDFITKYPTNETVVYQYGASLLHLGIDLDTAEMYLNEAMKLGMKEALFDYGMALYKNEKLEDALRVFQSYRMLSKKERTEDEVYDQVAAIHQAIKMMKSPVDVTITNLGPKVNTKDSEYTPIITGDGKNLYFTSRRDDSEGGLLDPNGVFFEDIYYTSKDSIWNQAIRLDSTINTKTHDATVALSADGSTMVIYRTNKILTGGDLYISYKNDSIGSFWSAPQKMNDNINTKYQEASACLSYNGRVMYFTSNRPGGMGGKDIYIVRLLPDGEWSKAQNLGPMINTPNDEESPSLNITSTVLYFSSNGHRTMGGFDIFKSEKVFNEWSFPENLGYPINTVNDELYLALDRTEHRGYYSSSKTGGYGQQDIYQIDFIYREAKDLVVKGLVVSEKNIPIVATIKLYDQEKDKEVGTYLTNKNTGKYIMALHPLIKYKIIITAEGYEPFEDYLYYDKLSFDLLEYDIELQHLIAK